jgi:hypothetical protein
LVETGCSCRGGEDLFTLGQEGGWDFIFGEDGVEGTFWDACAAINAGLRVNVVQGPFILRVAGDNTLDWTYRHATTVSNA